MIQPVLALNPGHVSQCSQITRTTTLPTAPQQQANQKHQSRELPDLHCSDLAGTSCMHNAGVVISGV